MLKLILLRLIGQGPFDLINECIVSIYLTIYQLIADFTPELRKVIYDLAFLIGAYNMISYIWETFTFCWRHCWMSGYAKWCFDRDYNETKKNWIMVTGATGGIGAEYCRNFAKLDMNLVLCSRTMSKLQTLEREIKMRWPKVKTRLIQMDFSGKNNMAYYDTIIEKVADLDLSMVVVCAGAMYAGKFENLSASELQEMLDLNIYQYVAFAKKFIPYLAEKRPDPNKSAIFFVSGLHGMCPLANNAVFHATKVFEN